VKSSAVEKKRKCAFGKEAGRAISILEDSRVETNKRVQMGIDISDVVGGRNVSDDYADYAYDTDYFRGRQGRWGAASFEARKSSLLQYIELSTV
jgi:hypothetical protein